MIRGPSSESAFIESLRALATDPAARHLSDDAAVLEFGGEALIMTHDMLVEGVHFLPDADPADVAWKLVATNLSDLAAKGGKPIGVLMGYMLGRDDPRFVEGLADALAHFDVSLLGGDTVGGGPPQTLGLTAIGQATWRPVPSRAGAKAGDKLYVTGPLGAAMLAFEALRSGATDADSAAYRRPQPRLAEGVALAPVVSAMMDVSDGLLLDAWRLAHASDVSLAIDSTAVPFRGPETRRLDAMRWGDDYELLFTAPSAADLPVPAYSIGTVGPSGFAPLFLDGTPIVNADGLGYEHGREPADPSTGADL